MTSDLPIGVHSLLFVIMLINSLTQFIRTGNQRKPVKVLSTLGNGNTVDIVSLMKLYL